MENKGFFTFTNHHKCLSQVSPLHFNTYMLILSGQGWIFIRHILTYKIGPRSEQVKVGPTLKLLLLVVALHFGLSRQELPRAV